MSDSSDFNFKNSLNYYDRKIEIPGFVFSGLQLSTFSEATYSLKKNKHEWVMGDTRQTKFDSIYTGTITNPVFRDIYAPVDGFVVNGGMKLHL